MGMLNVFVPVCGHKLNSFWLDLWILAKFPQSVHDRSCSIRFGDWLPGAHHQGSGLAKANFQGSYLFVSFCAILLWHTISKTFQQA